MRPATDPREDYKALVRRGYERCSAAYAAARRRDPPAALALLTARLAEGSRILDLGCGAGVPVARALSERYDVTGIDFSAEQIRRARLDAPRARFQDCDLLDFVAPEGSFDGVTAFYVLFHLPRAEQLELATRIARWLRPGGLFLGTVTELDEAPYTEDDFFGVEMFWTNFSRSRYQAIFVERGFQILDAGALGHGYREAERPEHHPLLLARRSS